MRGESTGNRKSRLVLRRGIRQRRLGRHCARLSHVTRP
jgi:hypothetical protein